MTTTYFWVAAALAAVWCGVHLIAGGRQIARPLRAATDLDPIVRDTQYLCWHFTSFSIASISGFFAWAGYSGEAAYATAGTVLAGGFALVGVGLVIKIRGRHADLPQGWLFLPVVVLGLLGLLS